MNTENTLVFSEDGTQGTIHFITGGESIIYTSKEEIYLALVDLTQKQKIKPAEFKKMRDATLRNQKMPLSDDGKTAEDIVDFIAGASLLLKSLIFATTSMSMMMDMPDQPVKEAYIKKCGCGKHASIICRRVFTGKFDNQYELLKVMRALREMDEITREEEDALIIQIENSGLTKMPVVDPLCN